MFDCRKAEVHLNLKYMSTIESWRLFKILRLACLKASAHFITVLVKTVRYYSFGVNLNICLFYIKGWEVIIIEWNIALPFSFSLSHSNSLLYFTFLQTVILSFCPYLTYSVFPPSAVSVPLEAPAHKKHIQTYTGIQSHTHTNWE